MNNVSDFDDDSDHTMRPRDETADLDSAPAPRVPSAAPQRIDRYRVERSLGAGGFGCVYLARDEQLDRWVAVKVPQGARQISAAEADRYLQEARTLASLDHPNIVPVYDVGRNAEFPCYLVSKYIEGHNLAQRLEQRRLTWQEAAEIVATVAEALQHAHQRGLFHRDIKPANILLDSVGKPYLADFGLALKEEELGTGPRFIGSPFYMSPEQARGEGHLVDGRTDIFSLGIVLYEMLTGHRPFRGDTPQDVLLQVQSLEARPPRQLDERIPKELERICLKAIAKRASDRYTTARDLADDLRWLLESSAARDNQRSGDSGRAASGPQGPKVVPKGLRSFDADDSDFFLELLPGPRDREGLPETIRFWKNRIEQRDPESTFRVGLIYGPSGCGKSSLVKAGLLPRLSPNVVTVYVEATSEDTLDRLRRSLGKGRPELPADWSLKDQLAAFRRGRFLQPGDKLLLVIDQFEQYLHTRTRGGDDELVEALRQCDGEHVQCVLLVRDDFWMAVSEFMRELEIRLVEGRNSAPLGLFDPLHARKVLAEFGRAFGRLPGNLRELDGEQELFLDEAVAGLCESGRIIPVRLSLFAEMIKGRPWTGETLSQLGGMEGVGASFLEESFGATTAPPQHRRHQKAAREVLAALLPERGSQITGHLRSYGELLEASGYANRPEEFEELLRILDDEVRLITPVDREAGAGDDAEVAEEDSTEHTRRTIVHLKETKRSLRQRAPARYYKLTHDYLVPSLRQWLAHKLRESRAGRAQLRLSDLNAVWSRTPDNRLLPGWWDAITIWLFTDRRHWSGPQQRMMRQAMRYYRTRWLALAALLTLLVLTGVRFRREILQIQQDSQQQQAQALVDALLFAPPNAVASAVTNLVPLKQYALPLLQVRFHDSTADNASRLRAAFGLAGCGEVETAFLLEQLATCQDDDVKNFAAALRREPRAVAELGRRGGLETDALTRCRIAAILLEHGDAELAAQVLAFAPDPHLRGMLIHGLLNWCHDLDRLPTVLRQNEDPALRSGICLAIGTAEPDRMYSQSAMRLLKELAELYRNDPRAAVHSAAGQALRAHRQSPAARMLEEDGQPIPPPLPGPPLPMSLDEWLRSSAPAGVERSASNASAAERERYDAYVRDFYAQVSPTLPAADRQWFIERYGITLLRIPPASGSPSPPRGIYLSDSEVPRDLFLRFIHDPHYPAAEKPAGWEPLESGQIDVPVQSVSWLDAALFCNWLSRRTGRKPCYVRTTDDAPPADDSATRDRLPAGWQLDPAANGYRLPNEAEWQHACRAGTVSDYCYGNDRQHLSLYAAHAGNARQPKPIALRLPNDFGCFDMHGNLWEWCQEGDVLRGGSYDLPAEELGWSARLPSAPEARNTTCGFRLALDRP
ncbi:MAG: protein kinase [Pirellulaceae bacterium]|nr:protein kinase [Pirellulaceae bacterium]